MSDVLDFFYIFADSLLEVGLAFFFFCRIAGKKVGLLQTLLFLTVGLGAVNLQMDILLERLIFAMLLCLAGVFLLKMRGRAAVFATVLTVELMQLCYGVSNALLGLASSCLYLAGSEAWILQVAGTLLALGLTCSCYWLIARRWGHRLAGQNQHTLTLLIPLLLIFAVSQYVNSTVYGNTIFFEQGIFLTNANDLQMLIVQTLAIVSIFSILYAYEKLEEGLFARAKLSLLEQETHFQRQYVEEAQARYEKTRSLRHDMKNHLLILNGLLEKGELEKAQAYLAEIDAAGASLSLPFQTNSPVLDILLENKTALAMSKGIRIQSSLTAPHPCAVGDFDFCIVLSNALDNAIHACEKMADNAEKQIRISSQEQGDFWLLQVENSFNGSQDFQKGVGLSNIQWVAEKYGGAVDIQADEKTFCLSVLLLISQQPEGILQQASDNLPKSAIK